MVARTNCVALVTRNPTRIQAWLGLWNDGPSVPGCGRCCHFLKYTI